MLLWESTKGQGKLKYRVKSFQHQHRDMYSSMVTHSEKCLFIFVDKDSYTSDMDPVKFNVVLLCSCSNVVLHQCTDKIGLVSQPTSAWFNGEAAVTTLHFSNTWKNLAKNDLAFDDVFSTI